MSSSLEALIDRVEALEEALADLGAVQAVDLAADLAAEIGRAKDAEAALGNRITAEQTAREGAVTAEKNRAEGVEANLATSTALAAEESARVAADTALGKRVTDEVGAEATARGLA